MRRLVWPLLVIMCASATTAEAQAPASVYGPPITLAQAKVAIEAASAEALRSGAKVAIAIVEPDGSLVAFARFDDAIYAATDLSQDKARTSARNRRATQDYFDLMSKGAVSLATLGVTASPGGVPIVWDEKVIGAIGVSGAAPAIDARIAQAGAAAFN